MKLPRLGQGMESGTIVKWLKNEGEPVEKGEPLYELDTDKVTQEVEAEASGVLLRIAIREGEVEVGRTIAVIGEAGEDVPSDAGDSDAGDSQETEEAGPTPPATETADDGAEQSAEKPAEAPAREAERRRGREASTEGVSVEPPAEQRAVVESGNGATQGGARIKASPLARRIARERGIDLASLGGTGPEGRIVAEDVERAAAAPAARVTATAPSAVEIRELSSVRRTIARRLTEAWQAPAFQLTISVDMSAAGDLLATIREVEPEVRPTMTDILARLSAAALMRHRDVNAQFADDAIHVFPTANIGIAVAAPNGLVVPVLPECERKTVAEIAAARADVVERARAGKLQHADFEDGTFTISNLGMYGVEQFIAVLNPPQAAILAVGAIEDRVVVKDGEIVARPTMTLTLTCDHRAVDGASGADFLRTLGRFVESPGLAL
ncbi:MAG: 2-oxo acid dehydrogenase subunit E2 [Actinobacteria bacterium]|nr:2-oxo acid dehydrogenase subunit E2 [Actinomycetota bacterium]